MKEIPSRRITYMKHNEFVINNIDENGMGSKIKFNNFKTDVSFMLNPEIVKYSGRVSKDTFGLIVDEIK